MLIFYLLMLLAVISLIFWQYERVVIARIITVSKIAKLCRKRDINFKVLNRIYPFSKESTVFPLRLRSTKNPMLAN